MPPNIECSSVMRHSMFLAATSLLTWIIEASSSCNMPSRSQTVYHWFWVGAEIWLIWLLIFSHIRSSPETWYMKALLNLGLLQEKMTVQSPASSG